MSIIPDDKVREVRERTDLVQVVSDYLPLRKAGRNWLGLCPFHGEKTPSFNVNPVRNIFHCFGCGVGGDVFAFVMRMEGLSFPETVKHLGRRAGVLIEDRPLTPQEKKKVDEKESLYRIVELSAQHYRRILTVEPSGESARSYLERRGVKPETAETYRLGFAPDAWDSLAHYLRRNGVPLDLAEKLGLVRRNERGGYYDLFRNRLLFVISDMQGRAIAFGGRVLDNSLPKYINSPESAIYHKSEVLFGLHLSKQAIREEASALIVEGYFDHLALFQAGVKNCVATCGTALTNEHARLLKRYAERVYALFDGDSAGRKATVRALDIFLDEELPASVIEVTAGEDPDSFIRQQGVEAFRERQRTARPIFDYFYRTLVSEPDAGTIEGKKRAADELVTRLRRMKNQVERDLYLREVARGLGVPEASLRRMLGGGALQEPQRNSDQPAAVRRISPAEMLISLMATFPEVVEMVRQHGVDRLFTGFLVTVAEELMRQVEGGEPVDWPRLLDILPSPEEKGRLSAILLNEPQLADLDPRKAFDQCCQSLERSSLGDFKELRRLLAVTDVESPRYRELLEEVERLRERKSRL